MATSFVLAGAFDHTPSVECACPGCCLQNGGRLNPPGDGGAHDGAHWSDGAIARLSGLDLLDEIGAGIFDALEEAAPVRAEQQATATYFSYDTDKNDADQGVDGLLSGSRWAQSDLTFSFPTSASDYEADYYDATAIASVSGLSAMQKGVVHDALDQYAAISGLTFTELGDDPGEEAIDADLRFARSDAPGTAYAYYPSSNPVGGDSFYNTGGYNSPQIGNYQYHTFLHELGHGLGLKHGHETSGAGAIPYELDSMEFSVMTYRSWVGKPLTYGYANETWGFSQSLMMLDIAAIQRMYGANFATEAGDTVYTFSTTTGEMFIDGAGVGTPGGNRVFRTVWDGNGTDTYDLSNYTTDLAIDLTPGGWSDFDVGGNFQRAKLEWGYQGNPVTYARGHLFNAMQYEGDARSLIENAVGGSGDDSFTGNAADNVFRGGAGADVFYDSEGSDTYFGDEGADSLIYSALFGAYSFSTSGAFLQIMDDAVGTAIDLVADTVETILFGDGSWSFSALYDFAGNAAPVAADDGYAVAEGAALNGGSVLGNDSDADGDALTVSAVNGQAGAVGTEITLASGALLTMLGDGTFTYDPNGAFDHLNSGESAEDSFTYTATDGVSGDTAVVTITVNGFSLPSAEIVSAADDAGSIQGALGDGDATDDAAPVLTGTLSAALTGGQSVSVYRDGAFIGAATVAGASWSFADGGLAEGAHVYTARVVDGAAEGALSAGFTLTVDLTAPAVTVDALTTNDATPALSGTVDDPAAAVAVTVDGQVLAAVNHGDGTWTLADGALSALGEGAHDVTAVATDAVGNAAGDATSGELVIDLTTPDAPTVDALLTNNATPLVTGTATLLAGETLSVTVGGIAYDNVAVAGGIWSVQIAAPLAEGAHDVIATVTDAAGNASSDATGGELVIDLTAPDAPTVDALTTGDATPVITGTAVLGAGETLSVTVGGVTHDDVAVAGGIWSVQIAAPLAEGVHDVTATATDAAGNAATDASAGELVIDLTAPDAPTVTALLTSDPTPVVTGTATLLAGESLSVTVGGVTYDNVAVTGGVWSAQIAAPLAEGAHDVTATVTDAAGNATSDATSGELVIDLSAPTAPAVDAMAPTNDPTPVVTGTAALDAGETLAVTVGGVTYDNLAVAEGAWSVQIAAPLAEGVHDVVATVTDEAGNFASDSSTGELVIDLTPPSAPAVNALTTNDATPVITGTAVLGAGETLSVTVGGVTYPNVAVTDGTWSFELSASLTEGVHDVTATVTDAAGNAASDATSGELVIDLTAPDAPAVEALLTNDATPVITGTATLGAGDSLSVTVGDVTYGDVEVTGGTWSAQIAEPLAEGAHDVTATVTDAAGNAASDATSGELVIDLTAPDAPAVDALLTNDATPVITGTTTLGAGDSLSVAVGGVTYSDVAVTGGTWSVELSAPLAEGAHDVTATVTDAAGNAASDATSGELVIDLTAPDAPAVDALLTNDADPVITGTATLGAGDSLSVTVGGVTYGDVEVTGGQWSVQLTAPLAEGVHDVAATVTDAAGNATPDATNGELEIDLTPPAAPTVTAQPPTGDSTPVVSGAATLGVGDTLSVTVDGTTYVDVPVIDGAWSLQLTTPLAEGTWDVIATVTDAAGNTSSDTTSAELVIDSAQGVELFGAAALSDTLAGGAGDDTIGGLEQDSAETGAGTIDTLTGGAGDDLFILGTSATVYYDDGNDRSGNNGKNDYALITDFGNGVDMVQLGGGGYLVETFAVNGVNGAGVFRDILGDGFDSKDELIGLLQGVTPASLTLSEQGGVTIITGGDGGGATLTVSVDALLTNDPTPALTGTVSDPTATVEVTVAGQTLTAANVGDGTWTLADNALAPLAEGVHDVSVMASAGGGAVDATGVLEIDLTAPVVTVDALTTTDATPALSGTVDDVAAAISVTVSGQTLAATNNGDGTWTLADNALTTLAAGPHDVTVAATDAAGNVGADSSIDELLIEAGTDIFIFGTDGSDDVTGNDLDNVISGMPETGGTLFGAGSIDILTGAGGADLFLLGEAGRIYYDDGNPKAGNNGKSDYGVIADFTVGLDLIQLSGGAGDYVLADWSQGGVSGVGIFFDSKGDGVLDSRDEAIGLVAGLITGDLDLATDFVFV